MEYINVVNNNSVVVVNDFYNNLSYHSSAIKYNLKRGLIEGKYNIDRKIVYTSGGQEVATMNDNEMVFISPDSENSYNTPLSFFYDNNRVYFLAPITDWLGYDNFGNSIPCSFYTNGGQPFGNGFWGYQRGGFSLKTHKFAYMDNNGSYGLEVYNDNGKRIFTSNNNYLKIKDFIYVEQSFNGQTYVNQWGGQVAAKGDMWSIGDPYDDGGVGAKHYLVTSRTYDEPVAAMVLSMPSANCPDDLLSRNPSKMTMFQYLSFPNRNTIQVWSEIGYQVSVYIDNGDGDDIYGGGIYNSTGQFENRSIGGGNNTTLAILVIGLNQYL